ncbi:MAG: enoyl-CoA hydratase/isomerase family protein, partial [Actinomycetota bacterium]
MLLTENIGPVRRLTMNRPDKLNSLNHDLTVAIDEAVAEAAEDDSVSVIILAAAGRAFCAGY